MIPTRLSRRRTWQSSCATMAFHCSGVRFSKMPSGTSRTGRKTPKIPGSRKDRDDIARIERPRGSVDPARTAALIRRQRIHHEIEMPMNPHAQTVQRIAGSQLRAGIAVVGIGDETVVTVNGWLSCSITTGTIAGAIAEPVLHPM